MAGLGEVCSHISALLFAVDANTHMQSTLSCTSMLRSWLPPSTASVEYVPLTDIDFTSPQQKRRQLLGTNELEASCSKYLY